MERFSPTYILKIGLFIFNRYEISNHFQMIPQEESFDTNCWFLFKDWRKTIDQINNIKYFELQKGKAFTESLLFLISEIT